MPIPFFTDLDLQQNELLNARIENLSSLPSPGNAGRMLFRTADDKAHLDNGTAFEALATEDYVDDAVDAAFERGSNANGEFVKFADGTMICNFQVAGAEITTASGDVFASDPYSWTFPATFAGSQTVVLAGIATSDRRWAVGRAANSTTGQARQYRYLASGSATDYQLLAVGRWF